MTSLFVLVVACGRVRSGELPGDPVAPGGSRWNWRLAVETVGSRLASKTLEGLAAHLIPARQAPVVILSGSVERNRPFRSGPMFGPVLDMPNRFTHAVIPVAAAALAGLRTFFATWPAELRDPSEPPASAPRPASLWLTGGQQVGNTTFKTSQRQSTMTRDEDPVK